MEKTIMQHGDVLLKEVDLSIIEKEGFKKVKSVEGYVVERGEGVHTHVLKNVADCEIYVNENGDMIVKPGKNTVLDHEEHGKMKVERPFIKRIEQEFDYESMEAYNTRD